MRAGLDISICLVVSISPRLRKGSSNCISPVLYTLYRITSALIKDLAASYGILKVLGQTKETFSLSTTLESCDI
jgi:hypothetical protein